MRFARKYWIPVLLSVVSLVATGLVVWAAMQPNGGCPPHAHLVITDWIPVSTGKSVIMTPIMSCES